MPHRSKLQIHSFKFPDPEKTYEVLAESDNGPFVIEFPNVIGLKFEINKKYPETHHIIMNFIAKCSKEILGLKKAAGSSILQEQGVEFGRAKRFIFKHNKNQETEYVSRRSAFAQGSIRSESLRMNRVYTSQNSKRSSVEPAESESNERNKTSKFRIRRNTRVQQQPESLTNFLSVRADGESLHHNGRSFSKPQSNLSSLLELYNEPDVPVPNREILSKNRDPTPPKHTILRNPKSTPSPVPGLLRMTPSIKKLGAYNSTSDFHQKDFPFSGKILNSHNLLTKESIRRYLYPELSDLEIHFDKKSWVFIGFIDKLTSSSGTWKYDT